MTFVDIKPVDYNLKTVQSLYRQEVLNDNRFPVLSGSISRSGRYRNQEDNTKFCIKVYCNSVRHVFQGYLQLRNIKSNMRTL